MRRAIALSMYVIEVEMAGGRFLAETAAGEQVVVNMLSDKETDDG